MKKYNTPELKVSMFNEESVLTVSSGTATLDAFAKEKNITVQNIAWSDLSLDDLNLTF